MTRSHPFLCLHLATIRPSPDTRRPRRTGLAWLALLLPFAATAALWNVRPAPDAKASPWAVVNSAGGFAARFGARVSDSLFILVVLFW